MQPALPLYPWIQQLPKTNRHTPPVLALRVSLLKRLLDRLLRVGALGGLLEGLGSDGSLQRLELKLVTGREEVRVVDDLDERLDLGSAGNLLLAHRLGHLQGVAVYQYTLT